MTVYLFDADKRMRKILPQGGVTELIHDEASFLLYATVRTEYNVINGEHIGFRCIDDKFRLFTVTNSEDKDDDQTTLITATDAIVQELKETVIEETQQLDVTLTTGIQTLLEAAGVGSMWTITGTEPDRVEKSRAYFADMWSMLEAYKLLYEWQITPYYVFSGNAITGRVLELSPDEAVFRGRILKSKKDASNVYVIRNRAPVTRLYGVGPATGSDDVQTNMTITNVSWSVSGGNPADKPKGQAWVEDPLAVAKYGLHAGIVSITDAEDEDDLMEKTWEQLQTLKEPSCTVEATIQDLERVPGYENQIIRLGDLVPIRLANARMEAARVIGIKRNYLQHWLTKIVIGDKEATIQSQVSGLIANAAHTFERLTIYKNRFHEDEALIQLNAEMIQMNAEVIEMNAKEIRANAELIDLKAGKEEVTELGTKLTAAEIRIDGIEAEILLKASSAELTEVENRLSSAEIRIDGAEAAIELKAEQSTVSAMEQRLSQAEIDIDGANAQISLKASQSTVDELGERVTSAELLIDGQNSKIEAKADLILLDGYVKTTELEAEVLTVFEANIDSAIAEYLSANELDVQSLVAASVNTNYLSADSITTDALRVGGYDLVSASLTMGATTATLFAPSDINLAHSHAVTVDGGTVTLGEVSSSGGSFNIADTQFYKDGVSAAKESGYNAGRLDYKPSAASISATVSGASDYQISVSLTNVYGNNVGTFSGLSLDARDVYDNGYDDGYAAGVANVTLSGSGWSGDSYTVTASNGTTFIVPAPSVSIAHGVQTASNNVLVIVTTADGTSLAAKNIDVTSVYDAAVESAELAVNETSVDVTFSDGTVKSLDVAEYVTATADVKYVSSTSTTMTVRGWGYAYFNGTYCASAYRNQTYDTAE